MVPPYVGMEVRVVHLGIVERAEIEAVRDDGRTLVVGTRRFTLRRLNGHYVREGEPYFGTRLILGDADDETAHAPGVRGR